MTASMPGDAPEDRAASRGATTADPPERVVWTSELVEKFWDYQSGFPEDYFTYQYGQQIVDRLGPHLAGRQEILDFGAGAGYLLRHLLNTGAGVTATDTSPRSLEVVQRAFGDSPRFRGGFLPEQLLDRQQSFDAVVCVEVVEHLYDEQLREALGIAHRLLSPGGVAVFTTPNQEDLRASEVYCPVSDVVFHRWQHVRSWDEVTLSASLRDTGFSSVSTFTTDFSLATGGGAAGVLRRAVRAARRSSARQPHLVAVAQR